MIQFVTFSNLQPKRSTLCLSGKHNADNRQRGAAQCQDQDHKTCRDLRHRQKSQREQCEHTCQDSADEGDFPPGMIFPGFDIRLRELPAGYRLAAVVSRGRRIRGFPAARNGGRCRLGRGGRRLEAGFALGIAGQYTTQSAEGFQILLLPLN